jgi:hypothetical protein
LDFNDKQIAPPKSWEKFEDLCLALFREIWGDPLAVKHGRKGQVQSGVDVYGCVDPSGATYQGVQCKGKETNYGAKATVPELKAELAKADTFSPPLQKWIFATTAPTDAKLQAAARTLSAARAKKGRFGITVLGWEDIQSLLASHPEVLKQFYPEHVLDLDAVVRALKALPATQGVTELNAIASAYSPAASPTSNSTPPLWLPVTFVRQRDLKPALMGRPLGPSDAISCPKLLESTTLAEELGRGYFARLVGEAGAGKSICAFQTAHHFAQAGWHVVMLADPSTVQIDLNEAGASKTLYLIDDAHLVAPWALARAEGQATDGAYLLSTYNSIEQSSARHGSIILDAKRAVRTIASALRKDLPNTLKTVKEIDDNVSDRPMDEDINWRLDQAETTADRPWQFCFILGGGWRRAKLLTDSARAAGADIILALAGVLQIARRDARCNRDTLAALLAKVALPTDTLDKSIAWLTDQRLLISKDDLRTPHQRFAAVALVQILKGQDEAKQTYIWDACREVLQDPQMPLAGLRTLLHELNFSNGIAWHSRVQLSWLAPIEQRCWAANEADRTTALLTLSEILSRRANWTQALSDDRKTKLVDWLSLPNNQTGYGLHQLLHTMRNTDEAFALSIMEEVDPVSAAATYCGVTPKTAFYLGKYLDAAWQMASERWRTRFRTAIDKEPMLRLAESWPTGEYVSSFSEYCRSAYWIDQSLGLDMVERFVPNLIARLEKEPSDTFHEFEDVAWHVLKGIDLLDIYTKKNRQTKREAAICRGICAKLDPKKVGQRLSHMTKRQFQAASWLLDFLRRAAPEVLKAVLHAIDWQAVDATIGDDWERLFHDGENLLRIASADPDTAKAISAIIDARLKDAELLSPTLAFLSPDLAIRHLDSGKTVGIVSGDHINWRGAPVVIVQLTKPRPDLVPVVLEPMVAPAALMLSKSHPSFWRDAHLFLHLIRQIAPDILGRMLDGVDPVTAEANWVTGIKSPPDIRRATSILVDVALGRTDALGDMARRIRKKYPSASKPIKSDLEEFTFN